MSVENEWKVPQRQWKRFLEFGDLPGFVFNETFSELRGDRDFNNGNKEANAWNAAYVAASHARRFLEEQGAIKAKASKVK